MKVRKVWPKYTPVSHKYLCISKIYVKLKPLFLLKTPHLEGILWRGDLSLHILNLNIEATLHLGKESLIPIGCCHNLGV
jgi:hypothetical protein